MVAPLQVYQQVTDGSALAKLMETYLEDYNSTTNTPMRLVLFTDAMEHVSRICRIISQPMGNALLLGVGCSGRRSLARLAAYMCDYEVFQVEICKGYGNNEWREVGCVYTICWSILPACLQSAVSSVNALGMGSRPSTQQRRDTDLRHVPVLHLQDLKRVLKKAGMEGQEIVFLFSDTQILHEGFLEDLNNILNAGEGVWQGYSSTMLMVCSVEYNRKHISNMCVAC